MKLPTGSTRPLEGVRLFCKAEEVLVSLGVILI